MMQLTMYVKDFTFSRASISNMISLVFSMLYLRTLLNPFCMLRTTGAENAAATLVVFYSIEGLGHM